MSTMGDNYFLNIFDIIIIIIIFTWSFRNHSNLVLKKHFFLLSMWLFFCGNHDTLFLKILWLEESLKNSIRLK